VFIVNVVYSYFIKREPTEANPWNSKGVEWQYKTPLPVHDFDKFPVFDGEPYPYGVETPGAPAVAPAS